MPPLAVFSIVQSRPPPMGKEDADGGQHGMVDGVHAQTVTAQPAKDKAPAVLARIRTV